MLEKITPQNEHWIKKAEVAGFALEPSPYHFEGNFLLSVPIDHGLTEPVGYLRFRENEEIIEPHVDWFPWATKRKKYDGFLATMKILTRIKNVLITCKDEDREFYDLFAEREVIRKVGKIINLSFGSTHIYQAVKT